MENRTDNSLARVTLTHFVPCFFAGAVLLYLADSLLPTNLIGLLADDKFSSLDFMAGGMAGIVLAGLTVGFHFARNRHIRRLDLHDLDPATSQKMAHAGFVGFLGGCLVVLLVLHTEGIIILTIFVLAILIWHLRLFFTHIVTMLRPDNVATWGDVSELLRIYLNMLAGFTLMNATLEGAHLLAGKAAPFGFSQDGTDMFINSLYYTVVTMTTLGFGDIVPTTWDAKLLLIFQCLAAYIMFALMIGIITRGVVRSKDKA